MYKLVDGRVVPMTDADKLRMERDWRDAFPGRKAARLAEVDHLRDEKLFGSFTYIFTAGPVTFQTRTRDHLNWIGLRSRAKDLLAARAADDPMPHLMVRDAHNQVHQLPVNELVAALGAMFDHASAIYKAAWDLKDVLQTVTDDDALDAVDIHDGWPG